MTRQIESSWRTRARQVIRETLDALPKNATAEDRRRALREAYPFGPRENHPYKMWCHEVKAAIGVKAREMKVNDGKPPDVHVTPLGVWCDWCEQKAGCLVCGETRRRNRIPGERRTCLIAFADQLNDARKGGAVDFGVFCDWLEDLGIDATHIRAEQRGGKRVLAAVLLIGRYAAMARKEKPDA